MRMALLGCWFMLGVLFPSACASAADPTVSPRVCFNADLRAPVVRTASELWVNAYPSYGMNKDLVIHQLDWEVRDSSFHRVDRFSADIDLMRRDIHDKRPGHREIEDSVLPGDLHGISNLPPGPYYLALIVNGARGSNVVSLRVDPAFNPASVPVLTLGLREASPEEHFRALTVWAMGPNPPDPQLTNYALACADVYVDGQLCRRMVGWERPSGPLRSGQCYVEDYDLKFGVLHPIDLHQAHYFQVRVGHYSSNTITANLSEHPWNDSWDAATPGDR